MSHFDVHFSCVVSIIKMGRAGHGTVAYGRIGQGTVAYGRVAYLIEF